MKNLKPCADNVLIERIEPKSTTPGGIILPGMVEQIHDRARVIAVGYEWVKEGMKRTVPCKAGDTIRYLVGTEKEVVTDAGKTLYFLKMDCVLAVEE